MTRILGYTIPRQKIDPVGLIVWLAIAAFCLGFWLGFIWWLT